MHVRRHAGHLNEISPPEARATFPGFTYQFGNFPAAGNATIQAMLTVWLGHDYGWGLGIVVGFGAACFLLLAGFGAEAKDVSMAIDPERSSRMTAPATVESASPTMLHTPRVSGRAG